MANREIFRGCGPHAEAPITGWESFALLIFVCLLPLLICAAALMMEG